MYYLISFLEGIITFISPCLLPMLPIYITYFAGKTEAGSKKVLVNALGFVLGFTLVFIALGTMAAGIGNFLSGHQSAVNLVSGLVVIFFGLTFLEILPVNIFRGGKQKGPGDELGFFSALLFGIIFSVSWTPCLGVFLGTALMMASQQGQVLTGTLMLLCYSLGLGLPFILSSLLIDRLKAAFGFIKKHYRTINLICGIFLIATGIMMATGTLGKLLVLFS